MSAHLFNLYAEYIMRNVKLNEAKAGINIAGKMSLTSDMQVMAESDENTLTKLKEENEEAGLKLNT